MKHREINNKISDSIAQLASVAHKIPAVIILHYIDDGAVAWMSEQGLKQLNVTLDYVTSLSADAYYARFFNPEDAKDYVPKIMGLIQSNNDEEMCAFFQQVRLKPNEDFSWHIASNKIFLRDDDGLPLLTITLAIPIESMQHVPTKANRMLKESNFFKENIASFSTLSKREKEILALMALGMSSAETAEKLFLAQSTVETHRKNIRRKLDTSSYYELCEYARAFDLI